jgi:O-antigen/teichoic acid export membrane protein
VAALSTTVALLLIRSWVIESKGLAFAGLFDAGWTLTFNYTTLFLTACSAIYLPRLTAAVRPEDHRACMLKTAYLVLGVGILACHAMVLLKEPLISLLYSPEFHASGEVLTVLVIAVLFRGVSWVYGTLILAARKSRVLVVSDVALNLLLLASTRYALDSFGSLQALSWAFVLPNFLYLVFVVEYACFYNPLMRRRDIWPLLLGGALPLLYFALTHSAPQGVSAGLAGGLAAAVGLCAGAAALLAYKKVTP